MDLFVIIKPNCPLTHYKIQYSLMKDYMIKRAERLCLTEDMVDKLYSDHLGKDFYPAHRTHMLSGPVIAMILTDIPGTDKLGDPIARLRTTIGATNPRDAFKYSIRGTYGTQLPDNAIHASDSREAIIRESRIIWFGFCPDMDEPDIG